MPAVPIDHPSRYDVRLGSSKRIQTIGLSLMDACPWHPVNLSGTKQVKATAHRLNVSELMTNALAMLQRIETHRIAKLAPDSCSG